MTVFGTRPEAIKMAPLYKVLKKQSDMDVITCVTGQHTNLLYQVLDAFGIMPEYDLHIMKQGQSLSYIIASIIEKITDVLQKEKPDIVLVHGDTSTSFAAALAAFNLKIPVGHVEAGLRTYDRYLPFPEEMNRRLTGQLANIHFAPTEKNKKMLFDENIKENVYVTGNTVIDAIKLTVKENYVFHNNQIGKLDFSKKRYTLITAHRRENWGENIEGLCDVINKITENIEDAAFIWPVHANPVVRDVVTKNCANNPNVILTESLDVFDMHNLMSRCYMIVTDSGGLQEEGPSLGKPVLVFRTQTERQEAVEAGTVKLMGVDTTNVYNDIYRLYNDTDIYNTMSKAVNPFGDGHASERIVNCIRTFLN